MRIASNAYNNPAGVEANRPDKVGKGVDSRKIDAQRDQAPEAKRDPLETRVNVSQQARKLATEQAVDLAKVGRLRAALDSGEFRVDPRAIAARIVADA